MTLLTPEWSRDLRRRASDPSFSAAREALDQRLTDYHRFLPQVPTHQAGYYHEFFCPECAAQFVYDPREPHRHLCPVCGAVYSGEPYDSAWRWSVNDMLSDAALKLAFRSHLTGGQGEQAQADRELSSRILFTYAERYRHMEPPPLDHPNHPGIVAWSGLDESVWLIRMCWAFALLEEALPEGSAGQLSQQMFRPGAEHIQRVRWPEIHNATNWNNAALATLALVLEDEDLLEVALGGDLGLEPQLTQGVSQDGIWWEGSLSYHYYMLDAVVWTLRVLRASGRSFDDGGILKRMFLAPILISFPDLKLPAVNDCWYFIGLQQRVGHGIPEADGFYETAYGWLRDPVFAWVLQQNYEDTPRTCFEALLDGAREIPSGREPEWKSLHMEDLGFAVLRGGDRKNGSHLIFKAGPDGGVHGHHDQLRIQLFAHGAPWLPDLGTPGYGIELNDTWYQQTASHATGLVDGLSQPLAEGKIHYYYTDEHYSVCDASVSWDEGAYAGVEMRRILLWRDHYFVDLLQVQCPTVRDLDWACQVRGERISEPLDLSPASPLTGDGGYAHVRLEGQVPEADNWKLSWRHQGGLLDLFPLEPSGPMFLGSAPSNPASETLSTCIRRRRAAEATFVAVFASCGANRKPKVEIAASSLENDGSRLIVVGMDRGRDLWTLRTEPGDVRLARL
ncbi:MAG: heparinase II/III family protein [Acidobacteriota bacterium]|nr:heparinase II/III family protein [Acidobacteriota bacterium]